MCFISLRTDCYGGYTLMGTLCLWIGWRVVYVDGFDDYAAAEVLDFSLLHLEIENGIRILVGSFVREFFDYCLQLCSLEAIL